MSKRRHARGGAYDDIPEDSRPPVVIPRPARTCPAIGCGTELGVTMLFCNDHWAATPPELQAGVIEHWTPGQAPMGELAPTPLWIDAVRDVIQFLKKEGGIR